ncbi:MAG: hypothetical protein ACK5ME_10795 [Parahaliea sp.]
MNHRMQNNRQSGVVLLAVLLLLLLSSLIIFSVMETSELEVKMVAAAQGRQLSFQGAESAIDWAKDDGNNLINAFINALDPNAPAFEVAYAQTDSNLRSSVQTRYQGEVIALGSSIELGSPGLRNLHFGLTSTVRRDDDAVDDDDHVDDDSRFAATHRQGIKRYAPKPI